MNEDANELQRELEKLRGENPFMHDLTVAALEISRGREIERQAIHRLIELVGDLDNRLKGANNA